MSDYRSEDPDGGFKKIFVAIAVIHLVLLGGLYLVARFQPRPNNDAVVWINPGSFGGNAAFDSSQAASAHETATPAAEEVGPSPTPISESTPADAEETPESPPPPIPPPVPESTPDIPLTTPLPSPPANEPSELAVSEPTPEHTATPAPEPSVEPTQRPIHKPKPKPTPTPTPARKLSPKPKPKPTPELSPKPKQTPTEKEEAKVTRKEKEKGTRHEKEKPKTESTPKPAVSPAKPEKSQTPSSSPEEGDEKVASGEARKKKAYEEATADSGSESGSGAAKGPGSGRGTGDAKGTSSGESGLEGYVGLLTNRFQAAWNQPTSEMALGKTLSVTVRIKIEPDGTVTNFEIVEGSGNAVVDDSVREAGKRLARLPPPPNGRAFSSPVRFELGN
ncbi:MAG TPA: TonB family protein [Chthoniobacterales bacterium]|nr:TonB family protein [Chthoniobacterales bacterium]